MHNAFFIKDQDKPRESEIAELTPLQAQKKSGGMDMKPPAALNRG